MKFSKLAFACSLGAMLGVIDPAVAEDSPHSLSANIAGTTNYLFRGISQTGNSPAIQGGFDYSYTPWSIYAGVWGSNVKSSGFAGASMELDLYVGWSPSWDKFGLDIGYLRYQYPTTDDNDLNTNEFHIGASYDFGYLTPSLTWNYSDDWYGTGTAHYVDLSLEVPLPYEVTLAGHYGWSGFDRDLDDYQDWRVGVSREFFGVGFDLSYVATTSIDKDINCDNDAFKCSDTLVFTVSKEF